jgi:hypothetical protein
MTTEPVPNPQPPSPPAALPPAAHPVARPTSAMAIVSLVFGILGWIAMPFFGSIVAVVTGHLARVEIRNSRDGMEGDGMAIAGLVLGWAMIALFALVLIGVVFLIAFFGGLAAATSHLVI